MQSVPDQDSKAAPFLGNASDAPHFPFLLWDVPAAASSLTTSRQTYRLCGVSDPYTATWYALCIYVSGPVLLPPAIAME